MPQPTPKHQANSGVPRKNKLGIFFGEIVHEEEEEFELADLQIDATMAAEEDPDKKSGVWVLDQQIDQPIDVEGNKVKETQNRKVVYSELLQIPMYLKPS